MPQGEWGLRATDCPVPVRASAEHQVGGAASGTGGQCRTKAGPDGCVEGRLEKNRRD